MVLATVAAKAESSALLTAAHELNVPIVSFAPRTYLREFKFRHHRLASRTPSERQASRKRLRSSRPGAADLCWPRLPGME